jgi:hypothetical protein
MTRILSALALLYAAAAAQSFFSPGGLGEASSTSDAAQLAQGGQTALSSANPGSYVRLDRTVLRFGGIFASAIGSTGAGSRGIVGVRPTGLEAAIPVPAGFRLLFGVNERFNQDFDIWSDSASDTLYRRHVVGRGGIYGLRAGVAKSFADIVAVGLEYGYLVGGARENWEYLVTNGFSSTDTVEADYRAGGLRAGLGFELGPVDLGAWFEPGIELSARRLRKVHGVVGDSDRTYRVNLPWTGGGALRVRPAERLGLSLGATVQPWSDASIADGDSTRSLDFRDAFRVSAGAEFLVTPEHPVRVGYSYSSWYFANSAGEPIVEHGVRAGTGFVVPKFGTVDLVAEALLRDTPSLRETALRLGFSLAYGEVWAKRTRRWGY